LYSLGAKSIAINYTRCEINTNSKLLVYVLARVATKL
jgi:hypothetical protein